MGTYLQTMFRNSDEIIFQHGITPNVHIMDGIIDGQNTDVKSQNMDGHKCHSSQHQGGWGIGEVILGFNQHAEQ